MASNRRPQASKNRGKKSHPSYSEKRIKGFDSHKPKYRGVWDD